MDNPVKTGGYKPKRDAKGRLLKGYSGNLKGRPPRIHSKAAQIKLAFFEAFEKVGGIEALVKWIKKNNTNKREFYKMLLQILPKDIKIDPSDALFDKYAELSTEKLIERLYELSNKGGGSRVPAAISRN